MTQEPYIPQDVLEPYQDPEEDTISSPESNGFKKIVDEGVNAMEILRSELQLLELSESLNQDSIEIINQQIRNHLPELALSILEQACGARYAAMFYIQRPYQRKDGSWDFRVIEPKRFTQLVLIADHLVQYLTKKDQWVRSVGQRKYWKLQSFGGYGGFHAGRLFVEQLWLQHKWPSDESDRYLSIESGDYTGWLIDPFNGQLVSRKPFINEVWPPGTDQIMPLQRVKFLTHDDSYDEKYHKSWKYKEQTQYQAPKYYSGVSQFPTPNLLRQEKIELSDYKFNVRPENVKHYETMAKEVVENYELLLEFLPTYQE